LIIIFILIFYFYYFLFIFLLFVVAKEAVDWTLRAAKMGNSWACFQMSAFYGRGILGLDVDQYEEIIWLRRSASSGLPPAQVQLALYLSQGFIFSFLNIFIFQFSFLSFFLKKKKIQIRNSESIGTRFGRSKNIIRKS